ncbi:TrmH family RNA methyltransferase [Patescibacteria group bacterium]|nr:TrmH family RNA methyltransferase [Patescibacteria group bacterium]
MPNPRLPGILVLENIRSLHNVGAIFRTADAAHVQRLILAGTTPKPPRHEIDKTALGAVETVPWEWTSRLNRYLRERKQEGYHLYALEQTGTAVDIFSADLLFPFILIAGHEREGVSRETLAECPVHLELPMRGESAHSLNVSTAAAIALYEFGRRFWYHSPK